MNTSAIRAAAGPGQHTHITLPAPSDGEVFVWGHCRGVVGSWSPGNRRRFYGVLARLR